jgi:hypothetical protein
MIGLDTPKIYVLRNKVEIFSKFQQYKIEVENQIGKKITMLKSDNGGEYKSNEFSISLSKAWYSTPIHHTSYLSTKWSL